MTAKEKLALIEPLWQQADAAQTQLAAADPNDEWILNGISEVANRLELIVKHLEQTETEGGER